MVSSIWSPSPPALTRIEEAGIVLGALLSPLWFFTTLGVNLNPADYVLVLVTASFVLRTGFLPYSISREAWLAIFVFLGIVGFSVLWSSNKIGGLLSFAQYLFIFVAVVPIVSHGLRDRSTRWKVFLAIWGATTVLTLLGIYTFVTGDAQRYRDIMLWYGNQNQFFWLVASGFICSVALALEDSLPTAVRLAVIVLAAVQAGLIVGGLTLSAVVMVAGGMWLFSAYLAQRRSRRAIAAFSLGTVLAGVAGLAFVVTNWEFVYVQGSLHARIPQYTTAIRLGVEHFPLGMGIDVYFQSVHNFFLNYFVEVGIVGATAFLALVVSWGRDVLLRSIRYSPRIAPFEFAFIAIFGAYVLVMVFQPVPVRRFWWVPFGASWAIVQDRFGTPTPKV